MKFKEVMSNPDCASENRTVFPTCLNLNPPPNAGPVFGTEWLPNTDEWVKFTSSCKSKAVPKQEKL